MMRATWDETWMSIADSLSLRSRCDGAKVGAVIVTASNRPVSMGYNGPPATYMPSVEAERTCNEWCVRRQTSDQGAQYGLACPSIHAEANALMFADRRDYEGGTIYVTAACCADCAKLISNSGIKRVVMRVRDEDAHRSPERVVHFLRNLCGLTVKTI